MISGPNGMDYLSHKDAVFFSDDKKDPKQEDVLPVPELALALILTFCEDVTLYCLRLVGNDEVKEQADRVLYERAMSSLPLECSSSDGTIQVKLSLDCRGFRLDRTGWIEHLISQGASLRQQDEEENSATTANANGNHHRGIRRDDGDETWWGDKARSSLEQDGLYHTTATTTTGGNPRSLGLQISPVGQTTPWVPESILDLTGIALFSFHENNIPIRKRLGQIRRAALHLWITATDAQTNKKDHHHPNNNSSSSNSNSTSTRNNSCNRNAIPFTSSVAELQSWTTIGIERWGMLDFPS